MRALTSHKDHFWLMHKGLKLEEKTLLLKKTIKESQKYKESYEKIKARPLDINTKGRFAPQV